MANLNLKSKAFLDKVFDDQTPRREVASVNIMKKSFPNYYKKFGNDPSAMSPNEYYKSNVTPHLEKGEPTTIFNTELAKDIYGDSSLTPSFIDPQIRQRAGFTNDEMPIKKEPLNSDLDGYFSPKDKIIRLNNKLENGHRAAVLMHEMEHAKDHKEGFEPVAEREIDPSKFKNDREKLEYFLYLKKHNPEELAVLQSGGHHQNFGSYQFDNPQYEIAKEHINQNIDVNPEILNRFKSLEGLKLAQDYFNLILKDRYIDKNSSSAPKSIDKEDDMDEFIKNLNRKNELFNGIRRITQ